MGGWKPLLSPSIVDLETEYLLQNYARYPVVLQRGKGCYLYDTSGKRYLDLLAGIGVNALGHAHPRLTKVIREQAGRLLHTSNLYYHEYAGPLAERLSKASGLARIFYCNSGTEANESRAQDGEGSRPCHLAGQIRDRVAGQFFPWTHDRRAVGDRPGKLPPRF